MTFLKWVGGKSRLSSIICEQLESIPNRENLIYYEPFLGSGSVLIEALKLDLFSDYVACDINPYLIRCHMDVRDNVDELIQILREMSTHISKEDYYIYRDIFNACIKKGLFNTETSALFIYLNKTCYRGLFRVNQRGEFNVPYGNYRNPTIFYEEDLREISELYRKNKVTFINRRFEDINIRKKAVVYLDPPYVGTFQSYWKNSEFDVDTFNMKVKDLHKKSCYIVLSQSNEYQYDKHCFDKTDIMINESMNPRVFRNEILLNNFSYL